MNPCCTPAGLDPGEPTQGLLLFGTGLAMSLGHCGGMCGPLLAAFGSSCGARGGGRVRLARAVAAYHLGRIAAYAALGALLGFLATAARSLRPDFDVRPIVALGAGIALLVPAVVLLVTAAPGEAAGWARPMRGLLGLLSRAVRPVARLGPAGLGAANGLLPCGPLALVAVGALATQGPGGAALALATYGLGTLPVLGAWTFGAGTLRLRPRPWIARAGAALLVLLALQMSLRGLAALGRIPHQEVGSWPLW